MSKKYHVRERSFLNLETEMRAYVIGVVEDTRDIPNSDENDWKWGKIELSLADCSREVSFDFDLSTPEDRENSLHKIRKIADVVNAVHRAIEVEAESINERQSFKPATQTMSASA
ncbi:MAG TPA: hypothetical protein PKA82_17020 [Pyrinomonadaceae bacterium]|nr:hypothetical protein [Pyrinomonadaceae bacterium]